MKQQQIIKNLVGFMDELQDRLVSAQGNPNDLSENVLKELYDGVCSIVTNYEDFITKNGDI